MLFGNYQAGVASARPLLIMILLEDSYSLVRTRAEYS